MRNLSTKIGQARNPWNQGAPKAREGKRPVERIDQCVMHMQTRQRQNLTWNSREKARRSSRVVFGKLILLATMTYVSNSCLFWSITRRSIYVLRVLARLYDHPKYSFDDVLFGQAKNVGIVYHSYTSAASQFLLTKMNPNANLDKFLW